jgi:hypothetical protein
MRLQSTCGTPRLMLRGWLRLASAGIFLLALSANLQPASAEFFQFATTATILNGYIPPTSIVTNNNSPSVTLTTPNAAAISLIGDASNSPGDNIDGTLTGSDIVFANISVTGLSHSSPLESITIPYTFHLVISDYAAFDSPGALAAVSFDISGTLTGSVGAGKRVNLSTNVYSPSNVLTKFVGAELYTLVLNSYVPPGPTNNGAFGVHVTAGLVPEPSTVTLLSLGALGLAIPAYRRWRRRA